MLHTIMSRISIFEYKGLRGSPAFFKDPDVLLIIRVLGRAIIRVHNYCLFPKESEASKMVLFLMELYQTFKGIVFESW